MDVIDYKTDRRPNEVDPNQLRLYAMMVRCQDERAVHSGSLIFLDDGTDWSEQLAENDLDATAQDVLRIVDEVTREREYFPQIGCHCISRDYRRICPRREEIVGRRLTESW